MSILSELSEKDGWIELEPPGDDAGPNTLGVYEGENVNYGFESSDEGEKLQGDEYHVYQSGPYNVEARFQDDGTRLVRVNSHGVEGRTFTTKPYKSPSGKYELNLPAPLVRHLGLDEVAEQETRTVDGEEQTVTRGVYVSIELDWGEDGLVVTVTPATEEQVAREESDEEADRSNVRRIQHRDSGEYTQYFIYFPQAVVTALGIEGKPFNWQVDGDELVAEIEAVPTNGRAVSSPANGTEGLATAPIAARRFRYETAPDAENAVETQQVGDLEIGIEITDETYADTSDEERTITIGTRGPYDQNRLVLRNEQSRALGLIPERKAEIVQPENRPEAAWLAEWTPEGLVYVLHTAPDELPESRVAGQNRVTFIINNWEGPGGEVTKDTPLEERYQRARNQLTVTVPKSVTQMTGVEGEPVYWWPTIDRFYDTGELILVGRPVSALPDGLDLEVEEVED